MLAFDFETTGLDLWHGCGPFAASFASTDTKDMWSFRWPVDPYTRRANIPVEDVYTIGQLLEENSIVAHNVGFDMKVAEIVLSHPEYPYRHTWNWNFIDDSILATHCHRNLWRHGLKHQRQFWIEDSDTSEEILQRAVNHARRICNNKKFKKEYGEWDIGKAPHPHWPGVTRRPTKGWWVVDMWLPGEIARLAPEFLPPEEQYQDILYKEHYEGYYLHPWENLVDLYCEEDTQTCAFIFEQLKYNLEQEDLWDQYLERKEVLQVCFEMEQTGCTIHKDRIEKDVNQYQKRISSLEGQMLDLLPKVSINFNSDADIRWVLHDYFSLPVKDHTDGGKPSVKEDAIDKLKDICDDQGLDEPRQFLTMLIERRHNLKASQYLNSYYNWSTPHGSLENVFWRQSSHATNNTANPKASDEQRQHVKTSAPNHHRVSRRSGSRGRSKRSTAVLHPNYNVTGTRFTRQSSSNPNLQNVGTGKEDETGEKDFELRKGFGPGKGRIWLANDYANLELRIWAFLCGNQEFIDAFAEDRSIHMLICRELHPELDHLSDKELKNTKEYKYTKNGDFAVIYGSTARNADRTYKVKGAYDKLGIRFPEVKTFTKELHKEVVTKGYIKTLTGYPLWIPVDEPHKAVSGMVQGTAGSIIGRAMINCHSFLSREYPEGKTIIQVHDELNFDLPEDVPEDVMSRLKYEMERIGDDIDIPLKVDSEIFKHNWAKGTAL